MHFHKLDKYHLLLGHLKKHFFLSYPLKSLRNGMILKKRWKHTSSFTFHWVYLICINEQHFLSSSAQTKSHQTYTITHSKKLRGWHSYQRNQRQPKRLGTINTSKIEIIIRETTRPELCPLALRKGRGQLMSCPLLT